MTTINDNFIMLPTVDFCFKELMQNSKVRQGFIGAVLGKDPGEIRETTLLPTATRQEYGDDKLGVLDVVVLLTDGTQLDLEMQVLNFAYWTHRILFYIGKMYTGQLKKGEPYENLKKCIHVSILDFIHFPEDKMCYHKIAFCDVKTGTPYTDLMELHILELKKLPEKARNEDGIIRWMRFFNGKKKEDFEEMAKTDQYMEEAFSELKKLSANERKRLEYEAREKAVRDYISLMGTELRLGLERGMKQGMEQGMKQGMEQGMKQGMEQGMKQGMEQGMKQGMEQGMKQGIEQGRKAALLGMIEKKLAKGRTYAQIAEDLEEEEAVIEELARRFTNVSHTDR